MAVRQVHFHDPDAPVASVVAPSVFVAARDERDRLLLVRRRDTGTWELPGGRVDVGESAVDAAVRETSEEAGVRVQVVGLVGLFTDPAHVVRSTLGDVRQQFVVCFRARPIWGRPRRPGRDDRCRLVRDLRDRDAGRGAGGAFLDRGGCLGGGRTSSRLNPCREDGGAALTTSNGSVSAPCTGPK